MFVQTDFKMLKSVKYLKYVKDQIFSYVKFLFDGY